MDDEDDRIACPMLGAPNPLDFQATFGIRQLGCPPSTARPLSTDGDPLNVPANRSPQYGCGVPLFRVRASLTGVVDGQRIKRV
jgi:hypothetical protein